MRGPSTPTPALHSTMIQASFIKQEACLLRIWDEIQHLEKLYPDFRRWYWGKVVPGVQTGSRRVFTSVTEGSLSGIVIAKSETEQKICTVWVPHHFRRKKIARQLMEQAIDWLGTEKPLFTVPESRALEFESLIRHLGFDYCGSLDGYYGDERTEHVYNGKIIQPLHS